MTTTDRPVATAPSADQHDRALAWFRALLQAIRSGDDVLRRLAQRELRALGVAVAPVPPRARP
jgi:hypothetical protein